MPAAGFLQRRHRAVAGIGQVVGAARGEGAARWRLARIGHLPGNGEERLAALPREVEARHVAAAFVALAQAERTTAHVMTVDGGNIEAALR